MITLQSAQKPCDLSEFCGDFHIAGKALCEGVKNSKECSLYVRTENEDSSGIYGNPLRR